MHSPTTTKRSAWLLLIACTCLAAPAWADDHGAHGRSAATPGGTAPSSGSSTKADVLSTEEKPEDKPWEFGATWETHRLFIQNDLAGAASNKLVNHLFLHLRWQPTRNDALEVRGYFYERFLADPGETGIRTDDTSLYYAHYADLPWDIRTRIYAVATAPTSFYSKLSSVYTTLRLGAAGHWKKDAFSFELIGYGETNIAKYREMAGGNPNVQYASGVVAELEYKLPINHPISVGLTGVLHWYWFYDITNTAASSIPYGVVQDAQFPKQPMQSSYGYQVYVRGDLPRLPHVDIDLTVAYAQGDPSIGYTSTLHDGVSHAYLFWRQTSQLYFALATRY